MNETWRHPCVPVCSTAPARPSRISTWSSRAYAIERLLYRINISKNADQFLLKGALLFDLWFDIPHRPTRDADFLGFGSAELPHIEFEGRGHGSLLRIWVDA
ncbi:nucleotidyl transferase AbiEii/AbiGii toxin family protein [Pseudoxanthomonas spadix]|jgi:hypothetical protein|uniref:nucleotidyl transferase AbiEii/AbiGii toxin family protein n=1 Tax=Pseudoxanthomonas spadix TaxID=415229 RepID=UPI001EE6699A|nr:nucleotidyl transferase AbiEii/AbiGii toxin family protein [Pseudoxanthomonas spadix]